MTSNTCILSGQNITHDIGAFTNTGPWATTPGGEFKKVTDTIKVSGCPASMTSVDLTPSWNIVSGHANEMANSGTATQVVGMFFSNSSETVESLYSSGVTAKFSLANSAVDIPFIQSYRHGIGNVKAQPGSMIFNGTFAFTYQ